MSQYIRFAFDTHKLGLKEPVIRLYPISCIHMGSPQCDMKFLQEHLYRLKHDPNGRWVYMGDGGECVTKLSKGDVYGQLMPPQAQIEALLDLLGPVKKQGLLGVRGNHGHRVYKETGLSFDHTLCSRLGIPYMGAATFANMVVNRSSYDLYFHHGTDSGITLRAKIAAAEAFGKFIRADAIFTAHSHIAQELQPCAELYCDNNATKCGTLLRHQYITGSFYDSRTGYAEDKGYPPLLPSCLRVTFDGRIVEGKAKKTQKCDRYESDGQHELNHDYIQEYLVRRLE